MGYTAFQIINSITFNSLEIEASTLLPFIIFHTLFHKCKKKTALAVTLYAFCHIFITLLEEIRQFEDACCS